MSHHLKIYLAGPEVFLPDAIEVGGRKKALCARYGFAGLYPLDNDVAQDKSGTRPDLLIYRSCIAHMRAADLAIFNLTPYRGASADAGTIFELGFFAGLGRPAFAYTNETEDLLDRVKRHNAATYDDEKDQWCDGLGHSIEDFGNADNLMIDMALAAQGRSVIRHAARPDERFHDLTGFEACLREAAKYLRAREAAPFAEP